MNHQSQRLNVVFSFMAVTFLATFSLYAALTPPLNFDHNYTYSEVVTYLQGLFKTYPKITKLHTIGKSYLGKDLLVLEITNQTNGKALEKPGYWIDGNLHANEVMGAAVCLKTIDTLVTQYGKDPFITNLINTKAIYIMPKLNPDGSDQYLTTPESVRSVVRPHDSDGDGLLDEDPPEDLNGDRYITQMWIRDELGPMKTSPEDPRLMIRRKEDEKGEWVVYSEGIDNDNDGRFNEDGTGGLDINRNWPSQWVQEWRVRGPGPYPLSEPEIRAVAEFLLSHRNITGTINHHMAGNYVYRPPCGPRPDPKTGEEEPFPPEDEIIYGVLGRKYSEILNNQRVVAVYSRKVPRLTPGMLMGWAYDHYGVISWLPEVGSYVPFCDYDKDGKDSPMERLRWNDTELKGKAFIDWKPYDHPQLGKVEIGGWTSKIYNPKYKSYTRLMCWPSSIYDDFLVKHTKWNLYLISMSPYVRIIDVKVTPLETRYFKIVASIQNQGFLPTNVTQHAIRNGTAKTVKATISLSGATLVFGKEKVDLEHLPGNLIRPSRRAQTAPSPIKKVEWMVKGTGKVAPTVVIKVISEKGGTDIKKLTLKR